MAAIIELAKKRGGKGRKGRKIGRQIKSPSHQRYVASGQRAKNKAKHILHQMKLHPNYKCPSGISQDIMTLAKRGSTTAS